MNITIERFDPSVDAASHDVTYEVPWHEYISVLEALMYIHENYESLSFDYSCRGALCGRCAMELDGEPVLACMKFLTDADHEVRPLPGFTVIRDLVVDKRRSQVDLAKTYDRVRIAPLTAEEINSPNPDFTPEVSDRLHMLEYCCRCQVCTSCCPGKAATPTYAGPSKMVAIGFRWLDPLDQADRLVEAVQNGLWDCLMCGHCDEVCENHEIKHVELFQIMRDAAEARGLKPADK